MISHPQGPAMKDDARERMREILASSTMNATTAAMIKLWEHVELSAATALDAMSTYAAEREAAAVSAEREACAKIAEQFTANNMSAHHVAAKNIIAADIRSRSSSDASAELRIMLAQKENGGNG